MNQVLLWMTVVPCVAIIIQVLRGWPRVMRGWLIVALGILTVTLLVHRWAPQQAGFPGIVLLVVFVAAPSWLASRVNRLSLMQRLNEAMPLARLLAALHPWDGFRSQPALIAALQAAEAGRIDESLAQLEALRNSRDVGRTATVHQLRIQGRWEELVALVDVSFDTQMLSQESRLVPLYLRGLGEIGELNLLVDMFDQTAAGFEARAHALTRNLCRLSLFAFCGQPAMLESLFRGPLADIPKPTQEFWLATAELTAGDRPAAERRMRAIEPGNNEVLRRSIDRRLAFSLPDPKQVMSPRSRMILAGADRERDEEHRFGAMRVVAGQTPAATYVLIALNVVVFLIEVAKGGSQNESVVIRMGALVVPLVRDGQWWRIITANFLHFGRLHLGMNMIGLYILGPFVEASLGKVRYLGVYLLSGILAMLGVFALIAKGVIHTDEVLGASGAIMGLIGATAGILVLGWLREGARAARAQLRAVAVLVGLQVAFDAMTPEVSSSAHLVGLASGFVLTLLLLPRERRARDRTAGGNANAY